MTRDEDMAFTEFLRQKATEAEALGYRPTQFKQMLALQGGDATVRQLLVRGKPSEGFTRLWELGRLDLTVEALVVETKWRALIDPMLVKQAERLLTQSKYRFIAFAAADSEVEVAPAPSGTSDAMPSSDTLPAKRLQPSRPRNTLSFSAFCESMGAPLANRANRWCGYNPERGIAVFTIWADRLRGDHYVLWNAAERSGDGRIGASELHRVLQQVIAAGHQAYGIRCEPKDREASPRERGYFDEHHLLVLRLSQEGENVIATVTGEVAAADVAKGLPAAVAPFASAINDLGSPPPGNPIPGRAAGKIGSGYRRDDAVRDYVLRRARGKCEYCETLGFEMADGSHYLEAHHVISLSSDGPDTVENVIALCPLHHREAHYGKSAEALEAAFLGKLKALSDPKVAMDGIAN